MGTYRIGYVNVCFSISPAPQARYGAFSRLVLLGKRMSLIRSHKENTLVENVVIWLSKFRLGTSHGPKQKL